jgi:hypothetical protein
MDSPAREPEPTFSQWLDGAFTRLALAVLLLGGLFLGFRYFGHDQLHEEIRRRVQEKLQDAYPGLQVQVEGARRLGDQGFEVHNVRIAEGGGRTAPTILEIHRLTASCNTRLPEFLTEPPMITGVRVRGFHLRAERKPSGVWNASHLLSIASSPASSPATIPAIAIEDGVIELVDSGSRTSTPLVLRNVQLQVRPGPSATPGDSVASLQFQGTMQGDHFDRTTISGQLSPHTGAWAIAGAVEGLEFTPRLRAALCEDWQQRLSSLASVRGRTRFGFEAHQADPTLPTEFSIAGEIAEGRVDDERLPDPLTDVTARIQADRKGLVIEELSARMGAASLELSGRCSGFSFHGPANWQLTGRGLALDRLPWDSLPPSLKSIRASFSPQGEVDVDARLQFDGQKWTRHATVTGRQLSVRYAKFPLQLSEGSGQVICRGDLCQVNLAAQAGGRTITCRGDLVHQPGGMIGRVDVASSGPVPIDDQLLTALPGSVEETVRALRPRGAVGVIARFERARTDEPFASAFELSLHDCSIQHEKFRYPLDRIAGRVIGEGGKWTFQELHGRNDSGYVVCNGAWDKDTGQLALTFVATDLPLEDELRQALSPVAQRLWAGLRPRGNLDHVRAELRYDAARKSTTLVADVQKWPASQNVQGRSISIEPTWAPLRLDQVTGGFHYHNGEVELRKVKAVYGKAGIEVEGRCRPDAQGGWVVELSRAVGDHLIVDEPLLAALPSQAAHKLASLKFAGMLGGQGTATIRLPVAGGQPVTSWDLAIDIENASLDCGRPVTRICGGARVSGQASGSEVSARGELLLDSFLVDRVQVTNLQGPFLLDSQRLLLGNWGAAPTAGKPPRPITAKAFAGQLQIDGFVSLQEDGRFGLQTLLDNGDLQTLTRELSSHPHNLSGRAFASLQLEGASRGSHTWRGAGKVRLQEADVSQTPLAVALVKLLTDKAVFTSSNLDFQIEGEDLEFSRFDLNGDALCLKGRGRMQLSSPRRVDLQFYSQMGRDEYQLPLLRPLLGAASKQFLVVEVTGTAEQPDVKKTMMPGINEQLRQLFPELAEGLPQTVPPPPLLASPRDWFGAGGSR